MPLEEFDSGWWILKPGKVDYIEGFRIDQIFVNNTMISLYIWA